MSTISYTNDVRTRVNELFEEKRNAAHADAERRKRELYEKLPGIYEIDTELSNTGLGIYREALVKGSKIPFEKRIDNLRKKNEELQNARAELLRAAGYPADYSSVRYECEKCSDTGYIGIDPCECLIRAYRKLAYESSGLGGVLAEQTFDNFDISLYPEDARKNMEFILSEAKKYAEDFGKDDFFGNIMFYGTTGLGKTHLSTAIARAVIDKGYYVIYDSALNIMRTFEKERYPKPGEELTSENYFECDLLVIDDLGNELMNAFSHSMLYSLLDRRINMKKGTVISTNLCSTAVMQKTYDGRVVSRIVGNFKAYGFTGNDIRLQNRRQSVGKK